METIKKNVNEIHGAKYNPRKVLKKNSPEYKKIRGSIEKFGYVDPIIINKDGTIIGGHQRFKILKDMGYEEIDVVQVDLNETEEKALNIALNKVSGEWDKEKLNDVLMDLAEEGFDIETVGFEFDDIDFDYTPEEVEEVEEKENQRMNTVYSYNLDLYDGYNTVGFYQMPYIKNDYHVPEDLIGFNYMKTSNEYNKGIHFYVDDYQFERLWNSPKQYIDDLKKFDCVLTPDFSLYMDMPIAMKIWNVYRSRLLGQYWQSLGMKVIPTISWAEKETFDFCFDGIEKYSTVSISTVGVKKSKEALKIWKNGLDEMIKKIKPVRILIYGGYIEYDYGDIEVIYYNNHVTERLKEYR